MGPELIALGGAFITAGLLARLGRKIGLPTIPFFMLAGILFGPNTPGLVLVEDPHSIEILAALGLILLLFHLGLEFSVDDLLGGGRSLLVVGGVYLALNLGGGLALGFVLGWGTNEALVIAGAVGISSSAIATKVLIDLRRFANPETPVILGIIVVEDIFLALYLALLQPVFHGVDPGLPTVLSILRAFLFLALLFAVARWGGKFVGRLIGAADDELLTVMFVGLAVLVAGMAERVGVSDAIGAFMVGLMVASTSLHARVEKLVHPLRDAFAAIFFFAFGLTIAPGSVGEVAGVVLVAIVMSLVLNMVAGVIAAKVYEMDRRSAAAIGLTVLGRGEFSLIIATLAAGAGLDSRIPPFVAGYVLILAIVAPILASQSKRIAQLIPQNWFPEPSELAAAED